VKRTEYSLGGEIPQPKGPATQNAVCRSPLRQTAFCVAGP